MRGESAATIGGATWAAWTKLGFEKDSLFADPQFVDADNNDFRLKPTSPALKLGFRRWDYSVAGRK